MAAAVTAIVMTAGGHAAAQPAALQTSEPDRLTSSDQLSGGARVEQALLFSGVDVWRNGWSGYGAVQSSANGIDNDGFIVRLLLSDGIERYRTATLTTTTNIFRAALLPGWRFKRGAFELKLFAGPDFEHHSVEPDRIAAKWRGAHGGARIAAEAWAEPSPQLMLTSSYYVTTIAYGYGFRAATGWRLGDRFWVGPEFSGTRDEFSRQTRFGVHLTGFRFAAIEWAAAAGYVADSFGRSGAYMRLGAQYRP